MASDIWPELSEEERVFSAYQIPFDYYLSDVDGRFYDMGFWFFAEELQKIRRGAFVEILAHPDDWNYKPR